MLEPGGRQLCAGHVADPHQAVAFAVGSFNAVARAVFEHPFANVVAAVQPHPCVASFSVHIGAFAIRGILQPLDKPVLSLLEGPRSPKSKLISETPMHVKSWREMHGPWQPIPAIWKMPGVPFGP